MGERSLLGRGFIVFWELVGPGCGNDLVLWISGSGINRGRRVAVDISASCLFNRFVPLFNYTRSDSTTKNKKSAAIPNESMMSIREESLRFTTFSSSLRCQFYRPL